VSAPIPPSSVGAELEVPVQLISPHGSAPVYALPGDAGADLTLAEDVELAPHQRALVGTGVAVAIDAGYRGEIKVNLVNLDPASTLRLHRGDRVAQLVVQPVVRARFVPVSELPASDRGAAGHGSTGGSATLAPSVPHPPARTEGQP
jgi:dUTP pyrophosphatase